MFRVYRWNGQETKFVNCEDIDKAKWAANFYAEQGYHVVIVAPANYEM